MICPKCGRKCDNGSAVCAGCGAPLSGDRGREPVTVFEVNDMGLLALAKSLLEDAGIRYFALGEGFRTYGIDMLGAPVRIQVAPEDEEQARELLAKLEEPPEEGFGEED